MGSNCSRSYSFSVCVCGLERKRCVRLHTLAVSVCVCDVDGSHFDVIFFFLLVLKTLLGETDHGAF